MQISRESQESPQRTNDDMLISAEAMSLQNNKILEIFNQIPDPAVIVNSNAKIVAINKKVVEKSGFNQEELVGKNFLRTNILTSKSKALLIKNLSKRLMGKQIDPYEIEVVTKDNKKLIFEINASKIEFGKMLASLVIFRDMTERRQMEKKITESELKFRNLVENSTVSICITDKRGKIFYVNKFMAALFGYSSKEMIGRSFKDFLHPDEKRRVMFLFFKIMFLKRQPRNLIFRAMRKDGKVLHLLTRPLKFILEGKVQGYQAILIDLTERKKAEIELKKSEEKFRHIYDSSINAIYTSSIEGEIIDMNPSGVSMLGYDDAEELKKVKIEDIYFDPKERQRFIKIAKNGPVKGFETKLKKKDKKIIDVIIDGYPIKNRKGDTIGFQGDIIDITKRRQLELDLSEMRDRQIRAKIEDQFISTATHELRTPLVSVKGYVDLALSRSVSRIPKDVISNLQVVKRNTERLLALTDDLLDLRRIQSGKLILNLENIDLKKIIQNMYNEIRLLAMEKDLKIRIKIPDEQLIIKGDEIRLNQVLMNLFDNAIKYTPKNGRINISLEDGGKYIRFKVSDTGIGIKKDDIKRIFEPFANIKKPTQVKGTNLGLSVAKGMIEAHGGKIWAESDGEWKGSTFIFMLPKKRLM
jgi:PAS domain S-box-containing protein